MSRTYRRALSLRLPFHLFSRGWVSVSFSFLFSFLSFHFVVEPFHSARREAWGEGRIRWRSRRHRLSRCWGGGASQAGGDQLERAATADPALDQLERAAADVHRRPTATRSARREHVRPARRRRHRYPYIPPPAPKSGCCVPWFLSFLSSWFCQTCKCYGLPWR